jgi:hypothetical protein
LVQVEEGLVFMAGTLGVEKTVEFCSSTREAPTVMNWWREVARLIGESEARTAMKSAGSSKALGAVGYVLARTKASGDETARKKRLVSALTYLKTHGWSEDCVKNALLISVLPGVGA